jgi:hypothetical protein
MPAKYVRTSPKDMSVGIRAALPPPASIPKEIVKKVSAEIAKRAANCHGNAIERANPTMLRQIIERLASGDSFGSISKETGYQKDTIRKIFREYPESIQIIREHQTVTAFMDEAEAREILRLKYEQMLDDPEQIAKANVRDIAICVSMANERYRNASGENKVVIEHRSGPSLEEFAKKLEEAKQKVREKAVINVTPEPTIPA